MSFQMTLRSYDAERSSSEQCAPLIGSRQGGRCSDEASPTNAHPVWPLPSHRDQRQDVMRSTGAPGDKADWKDSRVAAVVDTTKIGKYNTDSTDESGTMGSGCGGVSVLHSRCASTPACELSLLPSTEPSAVCNVVSVQQSPTSNSLSADADASHAVPAAFTLPTMPPPLLRTPVKGLGRRAQCALEHSDGQRCFVTRAMQAIGLQNSTGGISLRSVCSRSDLSSPSGGVCHVSCGNDPMGVRQLYSLPSSRAGSSLGIPTSTGRETAQRTTEQVNASVAAETFSMDRFATFYGVALEELVVECERRVANAPAAWRDSQRQLICGENNCDLATSTHSFDSPRSTVPSLPGRVASSVTAGCSLPVHRRFPSNSLHSSHWVHCRENSSDIGADPSRISSSLAPPSLHSHTAILTSTQQVCQMEPEKNVALEEAVPALLAALSRHHGKMAPMVFIAGLAYLARVTVLCASEYLSVTRANWYRLTTTAILVAAKMYDEHSSTRLNARFARSSGIPLCELTRLELDFLYLLDFDLLLKESEVEQWLTWMEMVALRHDLMTPLNTYVLGASASAATAQLTSASKPVSTNGFASAEHWGRTKTSAALEESCTAGLSTGVQDGEETFGTSPSSVAAACSFLHMRMESCSPLTAHGPVSNVAIFRSFTGAGTSNNGLSFYSPFSGFSNFQPHSSSSSRVLPNSLLDGTSSAVSATSLPGCGPSSSSIGTGAFLPPLPIHGASPLSQTVSKTRLVSVVHGADEPPSPISLRQLCGLAASPSSPLRPPSVERPSPLRFFKSHGVRAHGLQRHAGGVTATTDVSLYSAVKGCDKVSGRLSHEQVARVDSSNTPILAPAPTATKTRSRVITAEGPRSKLRWGPLGMVQHVCDVLGVTASLVRGQLNVLAPSANADESNRPPPPPPPPPPSPPPPPPQQQHSPPSRVVHWPRNSDCAYGAPVSRQMQLPTTSYSSCHRHRHRSVWPTAPLMSRRLPGSPSRIAPSSVLHHYSGPATSDAMSCSGLAHANLNSSARSQPYTNISAGAQTTDGDYTTYDEDEECEFSRYDDDDDDDDYFHYCDEDGEEGEWYDEGEDEEGEEEDTFFHRCPPPLTHSPPSL